MVDAQEQPPRQIPDPLTLRDKYHPSPDDWRTECIYFLLPDRFDDGYEGKREELGHERRFVDWQPGPNSALTKLYWNYWAISGRNRFQGGTLNGIRRRLQYLKDLGVTAIWLAPVFRQRAASVDANQCGDGTDDAYWPPKKEDLAKDYQNENYREVQTPRDDYHGYAIQNFLDVDPRFGTIADLQALVREAHELELRVIYDIVINHAAECFTYKVNGALNPIRPPFLPHDDRDRHYEFDRWLDAENEPKDWPNGWPGDWAKDLPEGWLDLDDGVWPQELQRKPNDLYSLRGLGSYGSDDEVEYRGSDYRNRDFAYPWEKPASANGKPPTCDALEAMVKIWSYWIAMTDCDGFRVDTYKHVPEWVSMEFSRRVREFAAGLGKRKFLIMGEIGGAEVQAARYLRQPELRLLSLDGRRWALRALAGGDSSLAARVLTPSIDKLNGFDGLSVADQDRVRDDINNREELIRDRFVMSVDDHDGLGLPELRRIAGTYGTRAVLPAAAFLLFGPGIPCLYYGTEQALTGPPLERANDKWQQQILGNLSDYGWNDRRRGGDRYLREAMFGPEFPLAAGPDGRKRETAGLDGRIREPDLGLDRRLPGFGPMGTSGRHAFDPTSPWYKGISALAKLRGGSSVLATGDITIVETGRLDRGRYGVGLPDGLIVWTRTAKDGLFGLIIVNLTAASSNVVSHRVEVRVPPERPVRRRVRILGENVEVDPIDAKRTLRADTGLCYLDLGTVKPGEIRVYLAE